MPTIDLTSADWSSMLDALRWATDDVAYDLDDTRNSDFYDPDERQLREEMIARWERLASLIAPLTREVTNAND